MINNVRQLSRSLVDISAINTIRNVWWEALCWREVGCPGPLPPLRLKSDVESVTSTKISNASVMPFVVQMNKLSVRLQQETRLYKMKRVPRSRHQLSGRQSVVKIELGQSRTAIKLSDSSVCSIYPSCIQFVRGLHCGQPWPSK